MDQDFEWENYPPPPTPRQVDDDEGINPGDYFQDDSLDYVDLAPPGAPASQLAPYEEEEDIIDDCDLLPPPRTPKPREGPTDSDEEFEMLGFSSEPYRPPTPEEGMSDESLRERDYMAAFEAREEESSFAYPPSGPTAYDDLDQIPLSNLPYEEPYEDDEYHLSQLALNEEIETATDGFRTLSTNYHEMPRESPQSLPRRTKRLIIRSDSGTEMIDATDPAAASNSTEIEGSSRTPTPEEEDDDLEVLSRPEYYRPIPTPGTKLHDPADLPSEPEEHPEVQEQVMKKKLKKKILKGGKSGVVLGTEKMVVSGVLYHLIKCRKRGCVKNSELLRDVMNGQTKDLPAVIEEMTTAFEDVFGLQMKGADKAGTKKGGFSSYILVSKFPASALEVNPPSEEESAKRVFLFVLLSILFMSQKSIDEESLWTYFHETLGFLSPAGCNDREHFRKFLREFVTSLYLKAEKVKDMDQITYNYSWGPRSEHEVSIYALLSFVAKTLNKRPYDFPLQFQMCLDKDKDAVEEDTEMNEEANRVLNIVDDGTSESLFAKAEHILRQSGRTGSDYKIDISDKKNTERAEKAAAKASGIAQGQILDISTSSSEEEIFEPPRTPGRPHREESDGDTTDIDLDDGGFSSLIRSFPIPKEREVREGEEEEIDLAFPDREPQDKTKKKMESTGELRRGKSRANEPETLVVNEEDEWEEERDDDDEEENEYAQRRRLVEVKEDEDDDDEDGGAGTLESDNDEEEEEELVEEGGGEDYEEQEIEEIDLENEEEFELPRTPRAILDDDDEETDFEALEEREREEDDHLSTGDYGDEDLEELKMLKAQGRERRAREREKVREINQMREGHVEEEVEEEEEETQPTSEEEEEEEAPLQIPSPFPEERIEDDFDNLLSSPIPSPYSREEEGDEGSVIPYLGLSKQEQWSREAAVAAVAGPSQPYMPPVEEAYPGELRLGDDVDVEGLLTQGVSLQLQLVDVEPMDFDTGSFPD